MVLPCIIKQNPVRLSLIQPCTINQTVDSGVVCFTNKRIAIQKIQSWDAHEILKVNHQKPSKMFCERDLIDKKNPCHFNVCGTTNIEASTLNLNNTQKKSLS